MYKSNDCFNINDVSYGSNFYGDNISNNNNNNNSQLENQNNLLQSSNKKKIIPISESNKESKKHFICKSCNTVPLIEFKSFEKLHYKCNCHEIPETNIEEILTINISDEEKNNLKDKKNNNNIIIKIDDKEVISLSKTVDDDKEINEGEIENKSHLLSLKCNLHNKKYAYYCLECKVNVCRKCISEGDRHVNHPLDLFDKYFFEINPILTNIEKFLKKKENNNDKLKAFKTLMNIIINDYKYFPNYNHIFIIKKCNKFISNENKSNSNSGQINQNKKLIFIKNQRELEENFNNAEIIKTIKINSSNPKIIEFMNILILDLINLTELDLNSNNIKSIEALANKKLENLELLNLAVNDIDDSNIKYIFNLEFPKLKDFNLFQNKLTDPEIFKIKNDQNKFKELKIFFVGNNKFEFKEKNKYNFSSLSEIGISKNCFNQESIKYIQCFTFINLTIIYLNANNLDKFNFIDNLELPLIKEFYLNNNNLNEYFPLSKYKTLERIEMKNNNINDIENLEEFIKCFHCLKKFNLEGNRIEYTLISFSSLESIKKNNKNINIIFHLYQK